MIFAPPGSGHPRWSTHAQAPTVLEISEDRWRIYVGGRDRSNRSHIFSVDVDPTERFRVLDVADTPLLAAGGPGTFDEHGMGPACALRVGDEIRLYYTGIARRSDVPYALAVGLATSVDNGRTFTRHGAAPVLSSAAGGPVFASTPCVWQQPGGWRALVMVGIRWELQAGRVDPVYDVRAAASRDGKAWQLENPPVLPLQAGEAGIARPWTIAGTDGSERVWFCRRGRDGFREGGHDAYRLESAVLASDGHWRREGPVGFENPPVGGDWDHAMQAYPCVRPWRGGQVMFYVGDQFGRGGFGWATSG